MATWPTKPEWIDPANINKGNEYAAADGVTVTDMNSIINDLLYLKEHGAGGKSEIVKLLDIPIQEIKAKINVIMEEQQ